MHKFQIFFIILILFIFINISLFAKEIIITYTYNINNKSIENSIFKNIFSKKSNNDIFMLCGNFINIEKNNKNIRNLNFLFNNYMFDIIALGDRELTYGINNIIELCSENKDLVFLNSNLQYCNDNTCFLFSKPYKELSIDENKLYLMSIINYKVKEKGLKLDDNYQEIINKNIGKENNIKIILLNNFDYNLIKNKIETSFESIYFIIGNNAEKFEKVNKSYIVSLNKNNFILGKLKLNIEKNKIKKAEKILINY